MQEIVIGPPLGEQLGQIVGQALLCDSEGRALGFFSPLPDHPAIDDLQFEPPLSIAETQKLREIQSGKPLSEILARLGLA